MMLFISSNNSCTDQKYEKGKPINSEVKNKEKRPNQLIIGAALWLELLAVVAFAAAAERAAPKGSRAG